MENLDPGGPPGGVPKMLDAVHRGTLPKIEMMKGGAWNPFWREGNYKERTKGVSNHMKRWKAICKYGGPYENMGGCTPHIVIRK